MRHAHRGIAGAVVAIALVGIGILVSAADVKVKPTQVLAVPGTPVEEALTANFGGAVASAELFTVPTGKVFVLEYVSAFLELDSGSTVNHVAFGSDTPHQQHAIVAHFHGSSAEQFHYSAAQSLRAYFPAGATVKVSSQVNGSGDFLTASISGYLIDE